MLRGPRTVNILDLGSWSVKLLRVEFKDNEILNCEVFQNCHQPFVQPKLDFKKHYLDHLNSSLKYLQEISSVTGPVQVLLPASVFTYKIDEKSPGHLCINLVEGIRDSINSILEGHRIEAAFLGSGLAAEIEFLRQLPVKGESLLLYSLNYSASFFVEISQNHVKRFIQNNSIHGLLLDTILDEHIAVDGCNNKLLGWKKDEIALLPIYRPIQNRLKTFDAIAPFINQVVRHLDECEDSSTPSTVFLSGGTTQLRNLDSFLEGTRTNEYQSFCTSFFSKWLENTSLGSDNLNGWASCFAHAELWNKREQINAKSNQKT